VEPTLKEKTGGGGIYVARLYSLSPLKEGTRQEPLVMRDNNEGCKNREK